MTTLERSRDDVMTTSSPTPSHPRRSARTGLLVTLVAVVALVLGGAVGWFVRGDDTSDVVLAGDGELTERQLEMVDFMNDYEAAWQRGDGDAVAAMYTPNGTFVSLGWTYRVDDGSLEAYVEGGGFGGLDVFEPALVHGNELLNFHSFPGAGVFVSSVQFNNSGDLLIVNHTITD